MELLAPVGNFNALEAAINAGADAVYLGGKRFSARSYATNFTEEEIAECIRYAHVRDVRVYVALNTLIFEDEFADAVQFARFLYLHDVDGILLQDLGLAFYLHRAFPDLVLHASTQLNCHNPAQAKSLIGMGFRRLVLAREVSSEEVKAIVALGAEVEVFVQGSLCVSYSGNCLMSSFIGNRSGNRGKCAQPCRNSMRVIGKEGAKGEYAVSTKDLMTLDRIEEYRKLGVDSLKIEGRMKQDEYIYQVVASYRRALDGTCVSVGNEIGKIRRIYNRKFTEGYLFGASRTQLLNPDTPSNLGIEIGEVVRIKGGTAEILLKEDVRLHDGIKFLNRRLDGFLLTAFKVQGRHAKEAKKGEIISVDIRGISLQKGTKVMRTSDSSLLEEIRKQMKIPKKIPLKLTLEGDIGEPFRVVVEDRRGNRAEYVSSCFLQKADSCPTSFAKIVAQMNRTDTFPYYFPSVDIRMPEGIFLPVSRINEARREVLLQIDRKRERMKEVVRNEEAYACRLDEVETRLCLVKTETEEQKAQVDSNRYDLCGEKGGAFVFLPRIDHRDEKKTKDRQIASYYKETEPGLTIFSPYGNTTNSYALDFLFSQGYSLVFASLECTFGQIEAMRRGFFRRHGFYPNLGIYLYGHPDYMVMKSCPIASAFQKKSDHCLLCSKNRFYLRDRLNSAYPLVTDGQCLTRVLSPRPICLFAQTEAIEKTGIRNFLIDFTIEDGKEVQRVFRAFEERKTLDQKDFSGHYFRATD